MREQEGSDDEGGLWGFAKQLLPESVTDVAEDASSMLEEIPGVGPMMSMLGLGGDHEDKKGHGHGKHGHGKHGHGHGKHGHHKAPKPAHHHEKKDKHPILHKALGMGKSLLHHFFD
jgi:ABC-type Zn2+ transport system substrate-binding protein/surface adhesin